MRGSRRDKKGTLAGEETVGSWLSGGHLSPGSSPCPSLHTLASAHMAWSCTQKRSSLSDWVHPATCSCCLELKLEYEFVGAILDPSDGAVAELTVYTLPRCSHGVRGRQRVSGPGRTEETPRGTVDRVLA